MKYIANPVEVDAFSIVSVGELPQGKFMLFFKDHPDFVADAPMVSRMTPHPGDYLVQQSDGYIYLNPKEVFERKYHPAEKGTNA
jgi:hypothetical protein